MKALRALEHGLGGLAQGDPDQGHHGLGGLAQGDPDEGWIMAWVLLLWEI